MCVCVCVCVSRPRAGRQCGPVLHAASIQPAGCSWRRSQPQVLRNIWWVRSHNVIRHSTHTHTHTLTHTRVIYMLKEDIVICSPHTGCKVIPSLYGWDKISIQQHIVWLPPVICYWCTGAKYWYFYLNAVNRLPAVWFTKSLHDSLWYRSLNLIYTNWKDFSDL